MPGNIRSYRDLLVWQKAMDLVVECYQMTRCFPKSETYGLCSQLQRAAVSIPSNIAEGHARQHIKEYVHHLFIASGSLAELETQIELARRLEYMSDEDCSQLIARCDEISRMLAGLRGALLRKQAPSGDANPAPPG